ncbi:MAG: hypothetical protein RIS36_414 [Pseudomonadota bacterium]
MVTNSGAITTATPYNPELLAGVPAGRRERSSSSSPAPTTLANSTDLTSLQRGGAGYGGRAEQILDLVVAAVTVVAEIVTLTLSRATTQERPPTRQPVRPPGAPQPSRPVAAPGRAKPPPSSEVFRGGSGKRLEAIRSDRGDISVRTHDGYIVRADATGGGWSITSPAGKTTRVMGGTNVRESDGGRWSLKGRGSFIFGAHKLTVEPSSVTKNGANPVRMTIYSGNERATIGGSSTGFPILEAVTSDAYFHDEAVHDGTRYLLGETKVGEAWSTISNGTRRVMGVK